jgi:subtilisin-like proprotein convertase family protein
VFTSIILEGDDAMNSAKLILVFLLLIILPVSVNSQWVSDPLSNLAICTADQTQRETEICNDNQGNSYIFWRDYRNEPSIFGGDIYAQKLNGSGEAQWVPNGISIVTKSAAQFDVKVIYDGIHGIYLVWREAVDLFSDYKIYAQRITLDGIKLWGSNGILLQTISGKAVAHSVSINEDGDLLITWQLGLSTPNTVDIYAQKINRDGIIQWTNDGMIICTTTGRYVYGSKIISDQNGGAYVSWTDNRTDLSNFDIYAQRVSSNGNILWTQNGIAVCTNQGNQYTKHIFSDNNGGAIIFWEDTQQSSYSIYAQRIDSLGNKLLAPDGKVLYPANNVFPQYEFLTDRNNEIYFLWANSDKNIFAQKLDYNCNFLWNNEVLVNAAQSSVSYLAVYPGDVNGIVAAWQDNRDGNFDVYSQWVSSNGITMWNNNGTAICNEVNEQTDHCIASDNFGGAVIAWADMRNGNFDIYTQNIDVCGKLGSNRYLFQKNGINKTISNLNPSSDTLSISLLPLEETGYYSVAVILDSIIHPAVNEITIKLTHLTKTDTLVCNLSSGQNFINTVLDDYALNIINSAIPPFNGLYKPYNPLSLFLGSDLNGEWLLTIEDNNGANDGLLKSWGLVFNKGELTSADNQIIISTPDNFILYQNHPNPFNPSTKISWQSPVSSYQTLKVYDILGNEVATLVNEYKPAGRYDVEFRPESSIKHPASGVYFYQLKCGEYVQTKKLLLIK